MNKTSRYLQYSIITLVFLALLTPLVFTSNMFFPYITGKAFYFRTVIEIVTGLYIILVCFDRSFLPKKSPITWALSAFLLIMAIATIFSVAPGKSFWSNFERMEGYVTLIHLGFLFLVASSVMKERRLWVYLFHASMGISLVTGLIALKDFAPENANLISGGRIQGTLGNSSYLGVYALFHIFLAAFFLLSHYARKNAKDILSRIFGYALIIVFNVVILFNTGTRGAMVGLGLGILLIALILAITERQTKKVRNLGIVILSLAIIGIAFLGSIRGTDFVKKYPTLDRYSSLVTWDIRGVLENQGYARAGLLWPMAWQGVLEKPVFGWGQDNFSYVFAKYYNPAAYAQEQWFDRTHNVFFDWLIAGGFLGLLGYLSLFGALIIVLWSKHPDNSKGHKWPLIERAVMTGLLLAYFIHNFFVFDNLTSYIIFFVLLAYFHERNVSASDSSNRKPEDMHAPLLSGEGSQWFVVTVTTVALVFALYHVNYKPYRNSANLIKGLQALNNHRNSSGEVVGPNPAETLDYFKSIFESNTTLGLAETRERLVEVASAVVMATSTSRELALEYDALTKEQYTNQFERFPGDPRYHYFFGLYLGRIGDLNGALEEVKKAQALSPKKQQFILQEGLILLNIKQYAQAMDAFKRAYDLEMKNDSARFLYAVSLVYAGKVSEALPLVENSDLAFDPTLIQAFVDVGRFDIIEKLAKKKIADDPRDVQAHISLAALYLKAKRNFDAIRELREAIKLEPAFKDQGEVYIKMIQEGKDPSQAQ